MYRYRSTTLVRAPCAIPLRDIPPQRVCCFVLWPNIGKLLRSQGFLTRAKGAPRHLRFRIASEPPHPVLTQTTWSGLILTLHLNYVAGCTNPLLFLSVQPHNYHVHKQGLDKQGLVPWRLLCLGRSNVRRRSDSSVKCDRNQAHRLGSNSP